MWAKTDSEGMENIPTGGLGRQLSEQEATAKRVLLVDDHNLFREVLTILCEQLMGLGNNVQAGSLAEARQVLSGHNSNDFALAVVDLDLPDAGGMELIGELYRAGIPVLALATSQDSERLARESGPEWGEVLTTASSFDEIVDAVRRIMRR
jgi:two-component system capsular synthesis sensor histidine kinase RcsC